MRKTLYRVVLGATVLALGVYLAALLHLYLTQQSQVFPGKTADSAVSAALTARTPPLRLVAIATPDGAVLAGRLLVRADRRESAPLVLYFGGNKEQCGQFLLDAPEALPGFSIAAVDYRGYGDSTGTPSEAALKADALLVHDRLKQASGASRTIVMGRSLGTALAAHVAANRAVAAVILVTPFDSIRAVGQERHPFVPVGLLLKNPFEVAPDASRIDAPALFLIAGQDVTVPPEHARRLAGAWRGQVKTVTLAADHESILSHPGYWRTIRDFLAQTGLEAN